MTRHLQIVPAYRDEVLGFVDEFHRHHGRPEGYIVAAAVADADGRVVGVYTLSRPVARALQDGWTCEVTRSCTDGTRNANSCLYGSAKRAAWALGYRRCVTYTEDGETGASLRAAGWLPAAELSPRAGWDTESRPREPGRDFIGRLRWEVTAGPPPFEARPKAVTTVPAEQLGPQGGLWDEAS